MSSPAINKYYRRVQKLKDWGGSRNESVIRQAFIELINHYADKKDLFLIPELAVEGKLGRKVTPDGTLKNALRLDYGYWESKDEEDDIDEEIEKKFALGYPDRNILFEDSQTAVLIQEGRETMRVPFSDPDKLDGILNAFVEHKHPEARKFEGALEQFKTDLPTILDTFRDKIEAANDKTEFVIARDAFLELCRVEINPDITAADIREMMIQHILTSDIFNKIFDEPDFHQHNNIGQQLEALIDTLFSYSERKNLLAALEHYYEVINAAAASIKDHHEKQQFLKVLYENFYKVYNPKAADRLGVVYTPNEIVRFMIRSTDQLLHRHFGKTLSSENVEILDPATGTGTFICDIIDHIPKQHLAHKYKHELHANEVAILPYYVSNLNIEYTFKQKMGYYEEFPNLCFVDTLDNTTALKYGGKQHEIFGLSSENAERIKRQNSKKISVIIGNPPYNANQKNENENNKNRAYPTIDKRIKNTFVKESTAQKTKVYDMYSRFYRWAMDRIEQNGIVAFITNRSFIDSRTFDGFRKCVQEDFAHCYIIDTHSDVRANPKIAGTSHNVFGIQTGVAVCFLVRQEKKSGRCHIHYHELSDELRKGEKLDWFRAQENILQLPLNEAIPDKSANWINVTDNDWDGLIAMCTKEVKAGKSGEALFKSYSTGYLTGRDEWVLSETAASLAAKMKYYTNIYNPAVGTDSFDESIKWSRNLKRRATSGRSEVFRRSQMRSIDHRPFIKKLIYDSEVFVDERGQFEKFLVGPNTILSFLCVHSSHEVAVLSGTTIADYCYLKQGNGGTQCVPQFIFSKDGTRHDNLTDWGLEQFTTHYKNKKITKEQVFHYVYAVLHDPVYREKYKLNLKREFPRIPFYKGFKKWSDWGKKLMDLHINYEEVKPYPLEVITSESKAAHKRKKETLLSVLEEPAPLFGREVKIKPKLRAKKEAGIIELDEITTIKGIPAEAWEYKLGNRSALEWVLDQHKEKKPRDPTIREKFNTYRFADHKDKVIDLLKRVTTVSVETMAIVRKMEGVER